MLERASSHTSQGIEDGTMRTITAGAMDFDTERKNNPSR